MCATSKRFEPCAMAFRPWRPDAVAIFSGLRVEEGRFGKTLANKEFERFAREGVCVEK